MSTEQQPTPPAPASAPAPKDDADRGAEVIRTAVEIMAQGARGWSDALKQASERVKP